MRVLKQTDRYVMLDDVLSPEQFALMLEYAARSDYARNPRWIKPWDLGDEMPWQTGETVYTRGKALGPQDPRKAYPTGLDWHDDEGRFAGAYTYYVHPRWHAPWGGELMIIEDVLGRSLLPAKRRMRNGRVEMVKETWDVLAKDDLSQMLMDGASSTEFVFAKPNRMVMMVGGVWHRVNVVKRNAPFPRASIAGFFLPESDDTPFWR